MNKAFTKEDEASLTDEPLPADEPVVAGGARYITPEGFKRLQDELQQIWRVERPKVTAEVSAAAAQGDRSENAEYIYGKKKLRELDRRIRYLSKRLDSLTVVEPRADADRVRFGAWVTIEEEDGESTEILPAFTSNSSGPTMRQVASAPSSSSMETQAPKSTRSAPACGSTTVKVSRRLER